MRLWDLVVGRARGRPVTVEDVCAIAVSVTGVDGASVAVLLRATPRETLYVSNPLSAVLAELTSTLGEGPGVDAGLNGPVLAADLTAADCVARWPVFAAQAVVAGVRAVFAFPLQVGGTRLGVLGLYRTATGELDRGQVADALTLTDTACALLLDGAGLDRPPTAGRLPEWVVSQNAAVHQASGMVAVQLGVNVATAMMRLRAHAYVTGRGLDEVAGDVVARRLRFDPDTTDGSGASAGDSTGDGEARDAR
jgi:hypothetical protein